VKKRGLSLPELMVGFGLLSLLTVLMFFVYKFGASAWKKSEAQTRLLQDAQVFTTLLSREAERTSHASVSLDPGPLTGTAVAFVSCWNTSTNRFEYDPAARGPVWQQHLLFYYDDVNQEVKVREIPLVPVSSTPIPLASIGSFRSAGRALARNVSGCTFSLQDRLLNLRLTLDVRRYGSPETEKLEVPTRVFFRN
jgi:type II secretory pathway pseudopilin PulG